MRTETVDQIHQMYLNRQFRINLRLALDAALESHRDMLKILGKIQ